MKYLLLGIFLMPLLGQATDLPEVNANFWKQFCICLLVLLAVLVAIVTLWALTRKAEPVKLKDDPAIEVRKAPKRYNHDQIDLRFKQVENRVASVEAEVDSTWDTIEALKEKQAERHLENSTRLARIMERLGISE